jgi:hypothetical protein
MRTLIIIIVVVILLVAGGLIVLNASQRSQEFVPEQTDSATNTPDLSADVESYVRTHISTLSPEKEVLGGTFYVTNIVLGEGRGIVTYEDGHNAYTADFTYTASPGTTSITSFVIRP